MVVPVEIAAVIDGGVARVGGIMESQPAAGKNIDGGASRDRGIVEPQPGSIRAEVPCARGIIDIHPRKIRPAADIVSVIEPTRRVGTIKSETVATRRACEQGGRSGDCRAEQQAKRESENCTTGIEAAADNLRWVGERAGLFVLGS